MNSWAGERELSPGFGTGWPEDERVEAEVPTQKPPQPGPAQALEQLTCGGSPGAEGKGTGHKGMVGRRVCTLAPLVPAFEPRELWKVWALYKCPHFRSEMNFLLHLVESL